MEDADIASSGFICETISMDEESSFEDMDEYGDYGTDLMTVFWNLEDYPIPESAELGSIRPRISKAFALMGFCGSTEIEGYADHLRYGVDELWDAGIGCSLSMLPAYMPKKMIVHAISRSPIREQVTLFVIANQIPGSELHRVQHCLKSRDYRVIVLDDPSKQCLFQSAESIVDCTRFVGAQQPVSRSGLDFFSGEKPIGRVRFAELQDELKQVLACGKHPADYASYVSSLCQTIAMGQNLILEDIIWHIRYICPIDVELYRIINKVLRERGFSLKFFLEDTPIETRSHCVQSPLLVLADPISKFDFFRHIFGPRISITPEDFSEPIAPVKTALFWDVMDCPFPFCSPDETYRRIHGALWKKGFRGEIVIWAYVDENNGPWTGEYLRNKTWDSGIYFLPGGDKVPRLRRMLDDILLWKMDMLSSLIITYTTENANVVVVSDQVREDAEFLTVLEYMSLDRLNSFLVTPTQHVNKPESMEWPVLLLDKVECIGSTCESSSPSSSSEPSPKRNKVDAAEETP